MRWSLFGHVADECYVVAFDHDAPDRSCGLLLGADLDSIFQHGIHKLVKTLPTKRQQQRVCAYYYLTLDAEVVIIVEPDFDAGLGLEKLEDQILTTTKGKGLSS